MAKIAEEVKEFKNYLEKQIIFPPLGDLSIDALVLITFFVKNYHIAGTNNFRPLGKIYDIITPNQRILTSSFVELIQKSYIRLCKTNSATELNEFYLEHGGLHFKMIMNYPHSNLGHADSVMIGMSHLKWTSNYGIKMFKEKLIENDLNGLARAYTSKELTDYWMSLATDECLDYIHKSAEQVGHFRIFPDFEFITHLKEILKRFSVSQIFKIIYSNTNYCLRVINDNQMKSTNFPSLFTITFMGYSNRAIKEGWEIKPYEKRHKSVPRSQLHKAFFQNLLGYKDDPFTLVISEENLKMIADGNSININAEN